MELVLEGDGGRPIDAAAAEADETLRRGLVGAKPPVSGSRTRARLGCCGVPPASVAPAPLEAGAGVEGLAAAEDEEGGAGDAASLRLVGSTLGESEWRFKKSLARLYRSITRTETTAERTRTLALIPTNPTQHQNASAHTVQRIQTPNPLPQPTTQVSSKVTHAVHRSHPFCAFVIVSVEIVFDRFAALCKG